MVEARFVDELGFGFGWIHPRPRFMQRASHALLSEGRVWIFDPTDVQGLDGRLLALGEPAGVIQLLDRHNRDCGRVARRLGVPLHRLEAGEAPFEPLRLSKHELALWWPAQRLLLVAEAVGTAAAYRTPGERLGVHPFLRLSPPRILLEREPEHLLLGHGAGLHGAQAASELRRSLRQARLRLPLLPLALLPHR
ncbi:MAG: hypothetical protein ACXVY3_03425 [Gaiellaceae bacterium]